MGVSGVDPPQPTGARIELGEQAGDEELLTEVVGDRRIHHVVGAEQVQPGVPGMAVRRHGEGGETGGRQPVADAVGREGHRGTHRPQQLGTQAHRL